jgi:hypothetical protein
MKFKVVEKFRDKHDHVTEYEQGVILDVQDEARAADLVSRGLVKEFKGNKKAEIILEPVAEPDADGAGTVAETDNNTETPCQN